MGPDFSARGGLPCPPPDRAGHAGREAYNGAVKSQVRSWWQSPYAIAVGTVAVATGLFLLGRDDFAKGQWALLYLLLVVFVAGIGGTRPAVVAAVLSFFAWNYFLLPPYHTLWVSDPKDWLSLAAFLIVGVTMGVQTGRLRQREALARAREGETALLYRFSAHLVSDLPVEEVTAALRAEVADITGAPVTLWLVDAAGELQPTPADGPGTERDVRELASWSFGHAKAINLPAPLPGEAGAGWPVSVAPDQADSEARDDIFIPLQTAGSQSGVLYLAPPAAGERYGWAQMRLVVALAHQASVFLDRKRLESLSVQADALREADRLKSTLVSAVSHELKTPLAALTATVTGLLEDDMPWDEGRARQELAALCEDLARLDSSIGSLLDLSRLEAADWRPKLEWYELGEILGTVLSRLPATQRERVSVSLPEDLPAVHVDFSQWVRAFEHLIGNALAYSTPETPVRVGARASSHDLRMWVEDEGPGITPAERVRVFEKFYRGDAANGTGGTGIGLAITSEIVRSHGGRIWIEGVRPHGARFVIGLPREEAAP